MNTVMSENDIQGLTEKYLSFALGEEEFCFEILKVREIIGYMAINPIPQSKDYVKGVINLRGEIISVVDLRGIFGMDKTEVTSLTCIIVVETSNGSKVCRTGVIVDRVLEVLDIRSEQIEEVESLGGVLDSPYLSGVSRVSESSKIMLNIDAILCEDHNES